jgi:HD-GYP domain-containing protein (c-di-GMP phosphodiesterase class II)
MFPFSRESNGTNIAEFSSEDKAMKDHQDFFSDLNKNIPLTQKLKLIHESVKSRFDFIDRISVALLDEKASRLKTFLASSGRDYPLEFYDTPLSQAPSLMEMIRTGSPRVLNDLSALNAGTHEHTRRILDQGYRASYTTGIYANGVLKGFVFFNSYDSPAFTESVLNDLDIYAHLISALVCQELVSQKAILSVLKAAYEIVLPEDSNKSARMERLSAYARFIAKGLAENLKYGFTDEEVEKISWLLPMLDLGKIGNTFPPIRVFRENFDSELTAMVEVLDRLAACYQNGCQKDKEYVVKSRILAAADLFDVLTASGKTVQGWTNEDAIRLLENMSSSEVDEDCVNVLKAGLPNVEKLQESWQRE